MINKKMPFWLAVLVNINIVIGAGFFLVIQKISSTNAAFSPLAWLFCGLIILPLVYAFASLAERYPTAGGIYIFSREELGPLWGIISGWGYYLGVAAANAVVMHAFTVTVLELPWITPWVADIPYAFLMGDVVVLAIFSWINCRNIEFLEPLQLGFTCLKLIPIVLLLLAVPALFSWKNLGEIPAAPLSTFSSSLPILLFAYIGVEACTSIMSQVENSKKNAKRVIFTSFALIVLIYSGLQFVAFGIHGGANVHAFFSLPNLMFSSPGLQNLASIGVRVGLLASFLAGFYGMFFFNNWNLQTMAKEINWPQTAFLKKLNLHGVPTNALLVQSTLIFLFLALSPDEEYMIVMADIGTVVAYLLSAVAFFTLSRSILWGALAVFSCLIFLYFSAENLLESGWMHALPFLILFCPPILWGMVNKADR